MFRLLIMFNPISMVMFCLSPSSMECRRGLLREQIAFSFNKLREKWFSGEPTHLTNQNIYHAEFYETKHGYKTCYMLSVPKMPKQELDQCYPDLRVEFREKLSFFPIPSFHKKVDWVIRNVNDVYGCDLEISRRFVSKNIDLIADGKHEFIVFFED